MEDDKLQNFFYYAARVDRNNDLQKETVRTKDNFINHFTSEYAPYADLFEEEFSVKLDDFAKLIDYILETITTQIKKNEKKFIHFDNGNVNIQAYGTILVFCESLFVTKQFLFEKFGKEINKIINRLTFNHDKFNEQQLRYNLIARQPILDFGEKLLISPELLLDSLFVNSHYSLLETATLKEEYKKRYALTFVNKISQIAKNHDYIEVTRELELYEGRNQIGDIDLVLKNANNHFLLVEAKNHAIPLDVYFHDFDATENRLQYLKNNWEAKVNKRFNHLQSNHSNYEISSSFSYIIISKFPEILSHFSDYLVLTLDEFEYWLSQENMTMDFQKIFKNYYQMDKNTFSVEQLHQIQKDLNTGWRFAKE